MTTPPRIDSRGDPLVSEFNQWYQASAEDWVEFEMTTLPSVVATHDEPMTLEAAIETIHRIAAKIEAM